MIIQYVETPGEIDEIRRLFLEYEAYLDVDLSFQSFKEELAGLPGKYAPPDGILLLAWEGLESAGCGALRKLDSGICEMKRLFVKPKFRGMCLGTTLAKRLIYEAIRLGYSTMLLDTLDRLKAAMMIYESLGFVRTKPYYQNPLTGVVYWKLDLTSIP